MGGLRRIPPVSPVQDERRFVAFVMDVRRGQAGRHPVIDDAQLAVAVAAADLGDGPGIEEPERLPFVGRDIAARGPSGRGLRLSGSFALALAWPKLSGRALSARAWGYRRAARMATGVPATAAPPLAIAVAR
jgi:hypothetical protein